MNISTLLVAAAGAVPDQVAVGSARAGLTYRELAHGASRVGAMLAEQAQPRVGILDVNTPAIPLVLYAAALAGQTVVPLNYRLSDDRLTALLRRIAPAVVIAGEPDRIQSCAVAGITIVNRTDVLAVADDRRAAAMEVAADAPDDVALLLFTSGTTGEPKAAVLRHRHLSSYVLSTVEFAAAGPGECALISVPAYHIAGIAAILTCTYGGRRFVQLPTFDPVGWIRLARQERVTHAMVVPTMLGRILDELASGETLEHLRFLSYGGGPMPPELIERALRRLPAVGFVNAYGLTETSSTISVLGPEDHRSAAASTDPAVRARLSSAGRPLPSVDVSVRDESGAPVRSGERGEIWVRGDQVAGEYADGGSTGGWFRTRDAGHLDESGYLFVHGRLDDVIVRGGENVSPDEIERALESHPAVAAAAVVGVPDSEWGELVAAVVVFAAGASATVDELREHVRGRLRSAMTPARIVVRPSLPYNETGKLLRRVVRSDLLAQAPDG